jgi:hypothetical protein
MIENVPAQYMELKNVPVGKVSLFATGKYLQVGGWGNLPNGKPLNIEVEWLRNGKSFQRNTSIMYAPIKFDKGKKISAKIFVNYPGYKSLVLVSNAIYIK